MMKCRNTFGIIAVCVFVAGLIGCDADDSAPTRPRQPLLLQENDNTEKRISEPKPANPATPPKEFPGQGRNDVKDFGAQVISAMGGLIKNATAQPGDVMPHLHTLPRDRYAEGEVAVPDSDYKIDNSWGQGLPQEKPLHRDWKKKTVSYQNGTANHNPTYYKPLESASRRLAFFSVQDSSGQPPEAAESSVKFSTIPADPNDTEAFVEKLNYVDAGTKKQFDIGGLGTQALNYPDAQLNKSIINQAGFSGNYPTTGSVLGYVGGTAIDGIWMVWETVTLPVQMWKQPPLTHVQTFVSPLSVFNDPVFLGAISDGGPVAPTAYPGAVHWKYPWTRPLGNMQNISTEVPELTPENSVDLRVKAKP